VYKLPMTSHVKRRTRFDLPDSAAQGLRSTCPESVGWGQMSMIGEVSPSRCRNRGTYM